MLFSEPKIPQSDGEIVVHHATRRFQCSSASRKFLNVWEQTRRVLRAPSFSALQRAENSSMQQPRPLRKTAHRCFSALQRAENSSIDSGIVADGVTYRFSALQRAENSSICGGACYVVGCCCAWFQCSSASRKFLNSLSRSATK